MRGKGRDSYLGGIGAGSQAPGAGRRDGAVSATGSDGTSRPQQRAGRTGAVRALFRRGGRGPLFRRGEARGSKVDPRPGSRKGPASPAAILNSRQGQAAAVTGTGAPREFGPPDSGGGWRGGVGGTVPAWGGEGMQAQERGGALRPEAVLTGRSRPPTCAPRRAAPRRFGQQPHTAAAAAS